MVLPIFERKKRLALDFLEKGNVASHRLAGAVEVADGF
jgi:hypothetical protein